MMALSRIITMLVLIVLTSCGNEDKTKQSAGEINTLFKLLPASHTGINFQNTLTEGLNTNVLMYEYFYNGGGVAVTDLNGDDLDDIFFTANMTADKLYLNKGNLKFADITNEAGIKTRSGPWKTGVTIADVNGDGRPDIYVCYSGNLRPGKRVNELYINQGNNKQGVPLFVEQAALYGLDSPAYSTQGYFFDYDQDGDLDLFLLNHNIQASPVLNEVSTVQMLKTIDKNSGCRLFRNDHNKFQDVTEQSGISSSPLTYGLGAGLADVNGDDWTDIYVGNDYNVPDYLYINQGNGKFGDRLSKSMGHTSHFSMGNDVADINNDSYPDIFTMDMLPEDNRRQKLLLAPDNYGKFDLNLRIGFHHQYMRNMLQLNKGDGTFSEIGQYAGISNTDWSWSALFADFDNDGWKDLFVTNGYSRDFTNMDFVKYMEDYMKSTGQLKRADILTIVHQMPSSNLKNYAFQNSHNHTFKNVTNDWGLSHAADSHGAAYSDLDNDGDLDYVVNNTNAVAFVYENRSNTRRDNNYLKIKLMGNKKNTAGLGAKVTVFTNGQKQLVEQMPARGFQSSVSAIVHFGLGSATRIDSLQVQWIGGRSQTHHQTDVNKLIVLREAEATDKVQPAIPVAPMMKADPLAIRYKHQQEPVNDFKRQPLMVNPLSFEGPCLAKGDVNNDGLEDVFAGGGAGQPGGLFVQQKNGTFVQRKQKDFDLDIDSNDVDAVFVDVNKDGFEDLYVCSGGYNNYVPGDARLQDRLYINDGKMNFTKSAGSLPDMRVSKGCVEVTDINNDGSPDLFIGGRVIPGRYPETPVSYWLVNDGTGKFADEIGKRAPGLQFIGMVTDALWTDINNDHQHDLVVVGEWMAVNFFVQQNGKLTERGKEFMDTPNTGWWNTIATGDFNQDGRADFVTGNLGLNAQCKASASQPIELYYKDYDNNGAIDPILCTYILGKRYPYVTRDELLEQIGAKRKLYPDYKRYADATLEDIFSTDELQGAARLEVNTLETVVWLSDSSGRYQKHLLPASVQWSPVHVITVLDYNEDGIDDLFLGGNVSQARLRFGKYDANPGIVLQNDGRGNFHSISMTGLHIDGDVRSAVMVNDKLIIGINGREVLSFDTRKH